MSTSAPVSADDLCLAGNELHKARKVDEAIILYQQACDAAPLDASPWSNLSAAQYELGDYAASMEAGDKALELLEDDVKKHKIMPRKAKSLEKNDLLEASWCQPSCS
ncbi:hypothetical protein CLAFUW4_02176 [Fulvia fulva]|uniref:Uncharacterized protein n=1 Tax=Passalora fulva TaxID=5499 RepID=A0A9Q8P3E1_PASFU|nr:uncharacterized protein CLAFUR5_02168 [Fulvia fulva]KAK4635052.1 hypothetical protein CLAFUR4_02172 [Fulvia fulva]KAK4636799.1 hypothetical protein CLAFUR0_02175 [Fulvia fulva]UJO11925.1 hypothetical protein CLAFUR5_02168 [Fulvia fulva]WPV08896.1 hypothetical protein CLAFUW4_02176 [Fulvia fulva]WPV23517.1 hypothetical protein CLAFUW7_02176 [Fulvia fulva]